MLPRVAIIILNWNKKNELLALLSVLKEIDYKFFDIVVVDNGSTDGSAEVVKKEYPHVNLIRNNENLGGTGGFNTGLRYACASNKYKYAWLLDNDVVVKHDTLSRLIEVMEKDEAVGLAGSRIMNKKDREFLVEMGGLLKRESIGVTPVLERPERHTGVLVFDVDYVAICSAVVRLSALGKVGLMDERFFIFWDDIDWGISFKKHGYKVVCVYTSVVYHDSFLEKDRGDHTNFYYGIRNPLLVYAKHFDLTKILRILIKCIPIKCMQLWYYFFTGKRFRAYLIFRAIKDFCFNQWGRCDARAVTKSYESKLLEVLIPRNERTPKILILAGSRKENQDVRQWCSEKFKDSEIYFLIQGSRASMYKRDFDNLISLEDEKIQQISYWGKILLRLLFQRFDVAVKPGSSIFGFLSFVAKESFCYENGIFLEDNQNLKHIALLPGSFLGGVIFGLGAAFVILICCRKYKADALQT